MIHGHSGHNCMRHGYVETMNCPRCDAADQKLREEGFKVGYDAGYVQGLESALVMTQSRRWMSDVEDELVEAIAKLKPSKP